MDKPIPNYFLVNRALIKSDRWLNEPFTRGQAWVDMCGLANHEDGFIRVRGVRFNIKRGQLGWSEVTLAHRWRWSRGKLKRFLNELKNNGDIVQQTNNVSSLITIVKYDLWQGDSTANSTANDTASSTANGQQTDSKQDTNNKKKKDKEEKEEEKKGVSEVKRKEGVRDRRTQNQNSSLAVCESLPSSGVSLIESPQIPPTPLTKTPKEIAREFFNSDNHDLYCDLLVQAGIPEDIARRELRKFVECWTEKNGAGTKQRWEMENTFEIERRLKTWFSRVKDFSNLKSKGLLIIS